MVAWILCLALVGSLSNAFPVNDILPISTSTSSLLPGSVPASNAILNSTASIVDAIWSPLTAEPHGSRAIEALVRRQLPQKYHRAFEFAISNLSSQEFDAFEVGAGVGGKVKITATSTSGLSRGLLQYLRSVGGDMYWSGSNFENIVDDNLVPPTMGMNGSSWGKFRYAFNVVTFSYTTAFYDFQQWEFLLDWASLHGINLPLATGGQEYIWRAVYRDYGMTEKDIYAWFSGPAFTGWSRMGNIRGSWGPNGTRPVSPGWIDQQFQLQKQILARMDALGMTPVLPAFNGFAPPQLHAIIGGPAFLDASNWSGFNSSLYTNDTAVDPTWSTFPVLQKAFLTKQLQLFGGWTSHMYSIDLYNELTPPSTDPAYLKNNTAGVISSLRAVDPTATWVMQGWLFVSSPTIWNSSTIPALLSGAKEDEMIVLDLTSEVNPAWNITSSFYGKQWIWNLLHDYGQNQGLYGSLEHYSKEIIRAKQNSTSLIGSGITMEGMNQNEIVYEFTLDSSFSTTPLDVSSWLFEWIQRRYGLCHQSEAAGASEAHAGWSKLASSAYNNTDFAVQGVIKSPLELVPTASGLLNRTGHHPTALTYAPLDIVAALDSLISAAELSPSLLDIFSFQMDLVDVARQVFINLAIPLYSNLVSSWNTTIPNLTKVSTSGALLVSLLNDTDSILASNRYFLVSNRISDAKSWSSNATEVAFLEFEARNQITVWGTVAAVWSLNRYASKQWSGVVGPYYGKGWQLFTDYLVATPPASYNATTFAAQLVPFEEEWQTRTWGTGVNETWGSVGNPLDVIKRMRAKWDSAIRAAYVV